MSLPTIARKHGVSYQTLYAAVTGTRPGYDPKVQRAVVEVREGFKRAAQEALNHA